MPPSASKSLDFAGGGKWQSLDQYSRAVGGLVIDERGNSVKAGINRTQGGDRSVACDGSPEKIQVGPGELIFTYTRLVGPKSK